MRVFILIAGLLALLVWFRPPHPVLKLVPAEPLPTLERYEGPRRSASNRGVLLR